MRDHLYPQGRGFDNRNHIYTAFSPYEFGLVNPDEPYLLPHHTLDHPFPAMVVEVVEPKHGVDRASILRHLQDTVLPAELAGSPMAAVLAFTPQPQPHSGPVPRVGSAAGAGHNVTLLWFLREDPRTCWSRFLDHAARLDAAGVKVVFCAPFIPTIPGTDTYVSELR